MREFLFWSAVLSCAAGQILIIRSTWRAREHAATAPMPAGVPRPGARSEMAWVILPAVMLAARPLLHVARDARARDADADDDARHAMSSL